MSWLDLAACDRVSLGRRCRLPGVLGAKAFQLLRKSSVFRAFRRWERIRDGLRRHSLRSSAIGSRHVRGTQGPIVEPCLGYLSGEKRVASAGMAQPDQHMRIPGCEGAKRGRLALGLVAVAIRLTVAIDGDAVIGT